MPRDLTRSLKAFIPDAERGFAAEMRTPYPARQPGEQMWERTGCEAASSHWMWQAWVLHAA